MSPGPAPKDRAFRHRGKMPAGGEWIDLPPVPTKPILPALPRRKKSEGPWSQRTRASWNAWRRDPATTQWTDSDIACATEAAYLLEEIVRQPKGALLSEYRLRLDGLGLTPKGKHNLRWRLRPPAEVVDLAASRKSDRHSDLRRRALTVAGHDHSGREGSDS